MIRKLLVYRKGDGRKEKMEEKIKRNGIPDRPKNRKGMEEKNRWKKRNGIPDRPKNSR